MPIVRQTAGQAPNPLQLSFIERIRAGRVVPVVGDEALADLVLGSWQGLVHGYAGYTGYPLPDKDNLVKVAKYRQLFGQDNEGRLGMQDQALKSDYLNWVKNYSFRTAETQGIDADMLAEAEEQVDSKTVSEFAHLLGLPHFDGGSAAPMLVWANLPIRVVLTTSPFTFIEDALRRAGKTPRSEVCRWRKALDTIEPAIDATYRPSAQEPLVYHLHGLDAYPDSLVLTEDDHLEFLVNVCQGQGNNAADRVHALVRQAMFNDLILLGYSLSSWSFRTLYAGMIKPNGKQEERGTVALQVTPSEDERHYLDDYVRREAKFDVFWGELSEYTQKLREMMSR
jgi:hypothetical protein